MYLFYLFPHLFISFILFIYLFIFSGLFLGPVSLPGAPVAQINANYKSQYQKVDLGEYNKQNTFIQINKIRSKID
jgi:hypothetical protein